MSVPGELLKNPRPIEEVRRYFRTITELGRNALELERQLRLIYKTLEAFGPFEVPEGHHILLVSNSFRTPLTIEAQDAEYNMPKFNRLRPGSDEYNRSLVSIQGGGIAYVGKSIEVDTDRKISRMWVYNEYRSTRALYDLDSLATLGSDEETRAQILR